MSKAPQVHSISTDEQRAVSVDCTAKLDSAELLSGTPTMQGSANLTFDNVQVNAAELTINDQVVSVGKAVQFLVSCNVPGTYPIELVCATDAGQTIEGEIKLIVNRSSF